MSEVRSRRRDDLACGVILMLIATFFLLNSGSDVWDWVFPVALSYTLLSCGAAISVLALKGLFPVVGYRVVVRPATLRSMLMSAWRPNPAWVFVPAAMVYVLLIPRIGFWFASLFVQVAIGLFLKREVSIRSLCGVTGFALVIGAALYYFMSEVFFIPLPRLTQFI